MSVVYTDGEYLLVHAMKDGPVTLRFPGGKAARDVLTGDLLNSAPAASLTLDLRFGETKFLRLE